MRGCEEKTQFTTLARRSFLQWALGAVGAFFSACTHPFRSKEIQTQHRAIIEAATARLIPRDEAAGAREANVTGYIERSFKLPFYRRHREVMDRGVRGLDELARNEWGFPFVSLSEDVQDRVLICMQGEDPDFFETLLTFTLEGFLGDPGHGGNKFEQGWEVIGYSPGGPRPGACGGHDH